jgi:hypothetical protein
LHRYRRNAGVVPSTENFFTEVRLIFSGRFFVEKICGAAQFAARAAFRLAAAH